MFPFPACTRAVAIAAVAIVLVGCAHKQAKRTTGPVSACSAWIGGKCISPGPESAYAAETIPTTIEEIEVVPLAPPGARDASEAETPAESPEPSKPKAPLVRMNLPEVVRQTLQTNPDVGIATARMQDAQFGIDVARAAQKPLVTASAGVGAENTYSDTGNTRGNLRREAALSVRQTLFDFGAIQKEIRRTQDLYDAASNRRDDAANNVALQVAEAYANLLSVDEQIVVATQNTVTHERIANLVKASEEEGNATVADVERAASRLEQARTVLIDLNSQRETTVETFIRLTEIRPGRLAALPRLKGQLKSEEELSRGIRDNREIQAIEAEMESLQNQIASTRAGRKPVIGLEMDANLRNDVGGDSGESHDARAMLRLRHTIYDGGFNKAVVRQLESRLLEAQERLRRTRKEVAETLKNNIRNNDTGRDKAASLRERVASTEKVLTLYLEQFKGGERTLFEVLDSQADLFGAQSELITNRYETLLTAYRSLATQGRLIEALKI